MGEAKFTPGPWRWYGNTKHGFYLATTHSGRLHVMGFERKGMRVAQPTFRDERHMMAPASDIPIFEVCHDATDPRDERVYRHDIVGFRNPDAHLIAAAPELYDALKVFAAEPLSTEPGHNRTRLFSFEDLDEKIRRARAAIAKAEGQG